MEYKVIQDRPKSADGEWCEPVVTYPVRIVIKNGCRLYCCRDLAILFGYNDKLYDTMMHFCPVQTKVVIPSRQGNRMGVCFIDELQTLGFIIRQLELKGLASKESSERQAYVFLKSLQDGERPGILTNLARKAPHPNDGNPACDSSKESTDRTSDVPGIGELDLRECMAVIRTCKEFMSGLRTLVNGR